MTIRHARRPDLPAVVTILNEATARGQNARLAPVTVADRAAWFDAHTPEAHPLWVAEASGEPSESASGGTASGEIAGWCSVGPWRAGRKALAATVEISVYVAPERQRQGVGRALVRHALEAAPGLGVRTLLAIGLETNAASLALLSREGFARWGSLPRVAEIGGRRVGQWILGRDV